MTQAHSSEQHILTETQFESWRTVLLEHSLVVDPTAVDTSSIECRVITEKLGTIGLALVAGDAIEMFADPTFAERRGPGRANLAFQISGTCVLTQHDRSATLCPGDLAIYETDAPYDLTFDGPFEHLVLSFTREFVHLAGDPAKVSACRMSGTSGVSGLASVLLKGIAEQLGSPLPSTQQLSNSVLNLIAAAVCEKRDQSPVRSFDTQGEALILQVKAFIDAQLHEPDLSSAGIARAHAISPRYLQKLFENEGTTVTEWVRSRRLAGCRADLADPDCDSSSIATIAARWGLVDSSYFSRMFKAAFGISPRDYRGQRAVGTENEAVAETVPSGPISRSPVSAGLIYRPTIRQ